MRIGELARETGIKTRTIRYYERAGVLPPPRRARSGYRDYGESDSRRLSFVVQARRLGLSLAAIGELVDAGEPDGVDCQRVAAALRTHRDSLNVLIREAEALRDALDRALEAESEASAAACGCPLMARGLEARAAREVPPRR